VCPPAREPLPERWIELLRHLDEREREEVAEAKPKSRTR
jgi:hypothetical protein